MTHSDTTKRIKEVAKKYGFTLIRKKKHLIFRNAEGLQVVTSQSSGDKRALKNFEANLKRLLSNHDKSNYTN